MLKRITDVKDINVILKNINFISVSQDKRKFFKDLLGQITDTNEELTVLIYTLNNELNHATLVAEKNLFSNYLRKFLVINKSNRTLWEVVRKNRIKIHRDLFNNEKVDIEIKSLNKSAAFGLPIKADDKNVIGAIWIFCNIKSNSINLYKNLTNILKEIANKIALKEKLDIITNDLH